MDGYAVDVGVVDEPDDLIGEELAVVLTGEVGLRGFGGVELESLPDPLAQDVQSGIRLHDFRHGLLDQRLTSGEPVAERAAGRRKRKNEGKIEGSNPRKSNE